MRRGWIAGVAGLLLLFVASAAWGAPSIFVNDQAVSLSPAPMARAGILFVPLEAFGLRLGVETDYVEEEGGYVLRWNGQKRFFATDHFPLINGVRYASLDELVALVDGQRHTIGDQIYVECPSHVATGMDASGTTVVVRFDAFVPYREIPSGSGTLVLRFYDCVLGTAPRRVVTTGGPVDGVRLEASDSATVDLVIDRSGTSAPRIRRLEQPGFYSVSFSFDQPAAIETQDEILPHITEHDLETNLGHGPVRVHYLYVDDWRNHYRLVPAVPSAGIGTLESLSSMARSCNAVAGINANFFDPSTELPIGLLVIGGRILSMNYARRASLGIDLFGRLDFFKPDASVYLRVGTDHVSIDDVNRPIGDNEVVAYTAGYQGTITRGASQTFRVVKLRDGRITAIQDGPFVIDDRSTDLLVACGTGLSRLAGLEVGEQVSIGYTLDQGEMLITDAVSAGPLLVSDGSDVLDPAAESFRTDSYLVNGLAARSVLATDYYGGLILLTVVRNKDSVGADFTDLLTLLHQLPVRVKNAIAFDGGHSSSLVFKDGAVYREISSGGDIAVGLLLVSNGS
jgi:exopolysaccharide biosynthesis protein